MTTVTSVNFGQHNHYTIRSVIFPHKCTILILIFLGKDITSYFNWGKDQPSDSDEHYCLAMRTSDGFRWHNMFCEGKYPFICMIGRYPLLYDKSGEIAIQKHK